MSNNEPNQWRKQKATELLDMLSENNRQITVFLAADIQPVIKALKKIKNEGSGTIPEEAFNNALKRWQEKEIGLIDNLRTALSEFDTSFTDIYRTVLPALDRVGEGSPPTEIQNIAFTQKKSKLDAAITTLGNLHNFFNKAQELVENKAANLSR